MLENKVKLVIWDLDDTFWTGTLTEGGITPIPGNAERVIELSKRGIINSICSKNDPEAAKAKLTELGVWDYFVFPAISFSPKGKAVADMIEGAALRPENVLFIDDNPSNLEEVRFFNPGIMTAHPETSLGLLLDHPHCAGKPDPELKRLNQYRFLQRKVEERNASALSNEEFLRLSNIMVTIDYDIDPHLDRIVELINRTNQLNYTKKRLNTPAELERFRKLLNERFGHHAGCIRATDAYGDYGLIGFFLLRRTALVNKLVHFVFSCRTMNMGIEQYVYELLEQPEIDIVAPVSYGLRSHQKINWINTSAQQEGGESKRADRKLMLLGGCDLLQVATYCSANRLEFVNRAAEDETKVRYEDPGFILGDRARIRDSEIIRRIPCWSYEDAVRFDNGLVSSDLIILSMRPAMNGDYYRTKDGIDIRMIPKFAKAIREKNPEWFDQNIFETAIDDDERLDRILASIDAVRSRSSETCSVFVLGCHMGEKTGPRSRRRAAFNAMCRNYCEKHSARFHFIDTSGVIPMEHMVSGTHFSRAGYFVLARHILGLADQLDKGGKSVLPISAPGLAA